MKVARVKSKALGKIQTEEICSSPRKSIVFNYDNLSVTIQAKKNDNIIAVTLTDQEIKDLYFFSAECKEKLFNKMIEEQNESK